jgi:hypothetical protein
MRDVDAILGKEHGRPDWNRDRLDVPHGAPEGSEPGAKRAHRAPIGLVAPRPQDSATPLGSIVGAANERAINGLTVACYPARPS